MKENMKENIKENMKKETECRISGLIKSQMYQLVRSRTLYISVIGVLAVEFIETLSLSLLDEYSVGQIIAEYSGLLMTISAIAAVLVAAFISGGDFNDKTANYEILCGHTRKEIFFVKAVLAMIIGTFAYVVTLVVPLVVNIFISGFGNELSVGEVMLRLFLSVLVTVRVICVMVCITYFIQNYAISMGMGALYFFIVPMLSTFMKGNNSLVLGLTTYIKLSDFHSWITYTMGSKVEYINVYDARLDMSDITGIIISSLLIGMGALIIGYSFYKREDLR